MSTSELHLLIKFLHELLNDPKCNNILAWMDKETGVFQITCTHNFLANLWGIEMNRPEMKYADMLKYLNSCCEQRLLQKLTPCTLRFLQNPNELERIRGTVIVKYNWLTSTKKIENAIISTNTELCSEEILDVKKETCEMWDENEGASSDITEFPINTECKEEYHSDSTD